MAKVTTKWGITVETDFKTKFNKAVTESVYGSPELKKELNRIFKQANTRINRLKDSGLWKTSPAYSALGSMVDKPGSRTYFTTAGLGGDYSDPFRWKQAQEDYARAVAFLNQDSSTEYGARQVEKKLRDETERSLGRQLPDNVWERIKDEHADHLSMLDEGLVTLNYSQYMERFLEYVDATESQMIQEMRDVEEAFQRSIAESIEDLYDFVMNDALGKGFDW